MIPLPLARRSARGFSLPEMLVASAVFLFVMLAAYQAFQRSQESYKLGQNQAEMVQAARVAFDDMSNDVRLAGFEFDLDGDKEHYPNQPDEPIEYMHRRAIVVRANFDFDKEFKGREPGLELPGAASTLCCPIVTTANEEIIGYGLSKPSGTLPTGSLVFKADTTGTASTADEIRRDAVVDLTTGVISGEETVTIPNVELGGPGDAGYAPPYTLYRFQLNEDGTVSRQPLIDNVYSLEFTYYDDSGNVVLGPSAPLTQASWGDDNTHDKEAGRATRWSVRRVKIKVQTLTPERDLRVAAQANSSVPNYQGKRLFAMEADILPPNLGRRGARDRDVNPPEPPRNITLCTGECNMIRVSWDPGPPEDRVADHVVTLCSDGPCQADGSNLIDSFIVIANFDVTQMKEYAVFTGQDSAGLYEGRVVYAQVVARNSAGTESECPAINDPACAGCCRSTSGATVGDKSRPDSFEKGIGGGYDPADNTFPNALADNSGGMLIVTSSASPYFPPSLVSRISLDTPRWALNKSPSAGTAPNDWTTKELGGPVISAVSCHQQESTPQDSSTDLRSPYASFWRDQERGNVYVWRAQAGASSTWGGANNVRSFLPTASNLLDFTYLDLTNANATYEDSSSYTFASTAQGDRYDGYVPNFVKTSGQAYRPPKAVSPCEVYYYRFRAISECWDDRQTDLPGGITLPPDGNGNPPGLDAWATATTSNYRALSKSITPFYPPLVPAGNGTGQRDQPYANTNDSDDYGGSPSSIDAYAVPSYNLPQRVLDGLGNITAWVKPEKPSEFYLTRIDENGTTAIQQFGNNQRFDARIIMNAARRTAPTTGQGDAQAAAFRTYRLYRKAASSDHPAAAEFDFNSASPTMLAEFDTMGPDDVAHYTLAGSTQVPGPQTFASLRDLASDWAGVSNDDNCSTDPDTRVAGETCIPYIYWLKTAQCTKFDDGIDTSSAETSDASRAFLFPCNLQYDVQSLSVSPASASTPPNGVDWTPVMVNDAGATSCADSGGTPRIAGARLLAYRNSDGDYSNATYWRQGDYLGSSNWKNYSSTDAAGCSPGHFSNADVQKAVRGYSGPVRFVVEISSADGVPEDESSNPTGCRLRSDFGPLDSQPIHALPAACASSCGTQASPQIFGAVDESQIELFNNNTSMRIHVPNLVSSCTGFTDFELRELEFRLEKSFASGDNDIPAFLGGTITGGPQQSIPLPAPTTQACDLVLGSGDHDRGEDDTDEADVDGTDGTMVLRWRDYWCQDTADPNDDPCACTWNYPRIQRNAPELTVELNFASSLCDVRLTQFNFRVPRTDSADGDGDGVTTEELVCTQRPHRTNDPVRTGDIIASQCPDATPATPPAGPAGADPDLPAGCTLEGAGRGPALTEELSCNTCTETCQPCQCPLNDNDADIAQDEDPGLLLQDDPLNDIGARNTQLDLQYTQHTQQPCDSPDCQFTISEIEIAFQCNADRDCANGETLGKLGDVEPPEPGDPPDAQLMHNSGSGPNVVLPPPSTIEQGDPAFRHYKWTGLSIPLTTGETFVLRMRFDDSIDRSTLTVANIRFAQPFQAECNADGSVGSGFGPLCSAPNPLIINP